MPDTAKRQLMHKLSRSLILMGRVLAPDMFTLATPDFHYEVESVLMDTSLKRVSMQWAREHAKSSLGAELLPIWHIFFQHIFEQKERRPRFVVLISKTQREAKRRVRSIKSILEDGSAPDGETPFSDLLGTWGETTARKWTEQEMILKDGTTIISTGWSQQGRGLKEKHQRPSLIVIDDPEDENNTKTAEAMDDHLEWLLSALEPATSSRGRTVLIGTPIRQRSMVRVIDDADDWHSLKYTTPYEEDGELKALWPERYSVEELEQKRRNLKAIGKEHLFYKNYKCQIVQGDNSPIGPEDFRYFDGYIEKQTDGPLTRHYLHVTHRGRNQDGSPQRLDEEEIIPVVVTMGVDPASSQSREADYSTVVVVAWTDTGEAYVVDYFRERVDPLEHANQIVERYKEYRPIQSRVESDGYQRMLRSYLNSDHFDVRIPGLEAAHNQQAGTQGDAKVERHLGLQYLFTNTGVYIKPHMEAFKEEWIYMADAAHDDLRDGFWWADQCKQTPTHSAEERDDPSRRRRPPRRDPMLT